jgi:parallel beta-helix repeat protein
MRKNLVFFNKTLVIGIFVLFAGMSIIPSSATIFEVNKPSAVSLGCNTLYVGGTGEGNYSKIQDAIDNASYCDTVFVLEDSSPYYENVVIDKDINLYGENKDTTIIDGMQESYVIDIQANDVHIKGFTIKNGAGDQYPSGILSYGHGGGYNNIQIEHNIITENKYGIYFMRTHNTKITNNIIKSNDAYGVIIYLSNNIVCQRNEITGQGDDAIRFIATPYCDISYNNISGNEYRAIDVVSNSDNSLISNNIIKDNGYIFCAFSLLISSNCIVRNNYFNNDVYLEMDISSYSYNHLIYHNDIYGEAGDQNCTSTWDDGYPSGGNYWSGYTGFDNDSDGIGDTPYYIPPGTEDRYPLMQPYNDNWTPYARFLYLEDKYNVSFDASSSYDFQGSIESYYWKFGDKTTGWGKTISHDYNEPGKYEVTLKVTDNDGTTDTTSWEVLLLPIPDLIPDLSCEGNLIWADVKPGETVECSFIVENIGDSDSLLDWEISEYPNWSEWTFTPSSGENLTPEDGPVTVQVSVIAPDEGNKEFNGTIKIVNSEDPSDFCEIDVLLRTPRNKWITNSLFLWFLERFPLLERLFNLREEI